MFNSISFSIMGLQILSFLFLCLSLLFFSLSSSQQDVINNQYGFFNLMKQSLSGNNYLSSWDENSYCNYTGITCDGRGYVVDMDLSGWSVTGNFPENICYYLPELRSLRLGHTKLYGKFPASIINCTHLEELNMTYLSLKGTLPSFSSLKNLMILDLSYNAFTGDFPLSVTNLTNLEVLNFNENGGFNMWQLPEEISRLSKLRVMVLSTCILTGHIPRSIGNMNELVDLELSGNFLTGQIPVELGKLKKLKNLELYYNQHLSGEIPEELGNLTDLLDLDLSVNQLTGKIPESLCKLPNLRVLQLYNNSLTGEIPSVIGNSTSLTMLSLYDNFLTGELPRNLGASSEMLVLDVSENRLSGELPPDICNGGKLKYFLVLQNLISGEIPQSYSKCETLLRFRVSYNHLQGSIPPGLLALPHVSIIDLSYNSLDGSIPNSIENAKNLSELFIQKNKISGVLPPEIAKAGNLVKIDLSNNLISGPIPKEIGNNLRKLNLLMLQGNKLNSSIPETLSSLKSLNVLDLSSNQLTGNIPENISELLPNSINFSNNCLSGPVPLSLIKGGLVESLNGNPGLCVAVYVNSTNNFPVCPQVFGRKKRNKIWVIVTSVVVVIIGLALFLQRWFNKERSAIQQEDLTTTSSFSYDVQSFHKITFDQREIVAALLDKNIVGHGGSGTVYKIELNNGYTVAVKKLWTRKTKDPSAEEQQQIVDKELKTEVQTLGSIRHKNIVKLYSYFSSSDLNLLVYEYMPNGNLWDSLHRGRTTTILDWPTRHRIALGIAQGLAYLHHDLLPPIVHRDIKSTNILLNADYQPKVADFGVAKVLQTRGKDSTATAIAGTYGYLAPEYAYTSRATAKCDVYSFGVVLMELITGKKPVEPEFGESKNIIYWVSCKVETKEGAAEVLDKRLLGLFKDEMIKVLRIAIRCTCRAPALRPTMNEVVQLLIEADPCRFDSCKSFNKMIKEQSNVMIKVKNPSELL